RYGSGPVVDGGQEARRNFPVLVPPVAALQQVGGWRRGTDVGERERRRRGRRVEMSGLCHLLSEVLPLLFHLRLPGPGDLVVAALHLLLDHRGDLRLQRVALFGRNVQQVGVLLGEAGAALGRELLAVRLLQRRHALAHLGGLLLPFAHLVPVVFHLLVF